VSLDGSWEITIQTPMGPQVSILELASDGTALTGRQSGHGETAPIYDGTVEGDGGRWRVDISQPFPLTVALTATVAGDAISGQAQAGAFPPAPFAGVRR